MAMWPSGEGVRSELAAPKAPPCRATMSSGLRFDASARWKRPGAFDKV
jgi:hypothetical protein